MKRILSLFALALSAIAASSLSYNQANPTVALKIPQTGFSCGVFSAQSYYCYGLPVVIASNGVSSTGYLWTDDYAATSGGKGFVNFYQVPVPNAVINSRKSTPDGGVEEDISGPNYAGKLRWLSSPARRGSGPDPRGLQSRAVPGAPHPESPA